MSTADGISEGEEGQESSDDKESVLLWDSFVSK